MRRSIKTLFDFELPARPDEVHAAALPFVRKPGGSTRPRKANQAAFERAVDIAARVAERLLAELVTPAYLCADSGSKRLFADTEACGRLHGGFGWKQLKSLAPRGVELER